MKKTIADSIELTRGIGLFNQAHFFDAHEVLEDVWRPSPRGSTRRKHLQGLVQLAVAFHHESRGNFIGARSVLDRAFRNLAGAENSFPQLDFARLRAELADWQRHLADACVGSKSSRPALPCITLRGRQSPVKISKK
jgi:predicted metal-dependent hydrolase